MQSWTPLQHVRAIGAWPARARPAASGTGSCCQHPPYRHASPIKHLRGVHSSTRPPSARSSKSEHLTWDAARASAPSDLPLPPFLRPENRANKRIAALAHRRSRKPPEDVYISPTDRKLIKPRAENMRRAPFSVAFAETPYAHALATPVREDRFTDARMPMSCLLSFHPVDLNDDSALSVEQAADAQDDAGKTKKKAKSGDKQYDMMPLSLAAELVSKKKRDLPNDELRALDAVGQDTLYTPLGSGSYVLCSKEALDHISEKPKTRPKGKAVSRRVLMELGTTKVGWRPDMGDFVLSALRKVLLKKMRFFFLRKTDADRPGAVCAMPGGAGLERLDDVDDVMCVLRLKAEDEEDAEQAVRAGNEGIDEDAQETVTIVASDGPGTEELIDGPGDDEIRGHHKVAEHVTPDESEFALEADTNLDSDAASSAYQGPSNTSPDDDNKPTVYPNASQTHRTRTGHWTDYQQKHEPHLLNLSIPAPPPQPSAIYFPTLPYRNRRVAAYHLPFLLGQEKTDELVKDSVFRDCEHVAITGGVLTVGVQMWLLKIAAFLGKGKGEMPRI